MEPVFNQALKAGRVGFVTDTYIQCISNTIKVRKRANIRNRYNQAPHLTQDTNEKVTSQVDKHSRRG